MRRGDPWGAPAAGPPDVTVRGGDAELADAIRSWPGARVALEAVEGSDVARTVGIRSGESQRSTELPFDAIELDDGTLVVNAVVMGVRPDRLRRRHRRRPVVVHVDGRAVFDGRATTVVVATGQYLGGTDLVPRGHPGDGRVEVQVYALDPGQRAAMRARLATGTHVPHPDIAEAAGASIEVSTARRWPVQVDSRPVSARSGLTATVRTGAWRLLV